MVYRLTDNHMKISAGYEDIDRDRPFELGERFTREPSVKFLRPDEADWLAKCLPNPMTVGRAVDPDTVPRRVRWCDKQMDPAPDVDRCCNTLLISARVRDVMARFEPGEHQYLPVDIHLSPRPFEAGEVAVARSFWLVVGRYLDAVSAEHTHYPRSVSVRADGRKEPGMWDFSGHLTNQPKGHGPVIFDRGMIAGRHLWIDRNIFRHEHPFMSDELGNALLAMDLYGAQFEHFDEV